VVYFKSTLKLKYRCVHYWVNNVCLNWVKRNVNYVIRPCWIFLLHCLGAPRTLGAPGLCPSLSIGCDATGREPNVGGWPWQTLGAIRAVATVWEGAEIFFFGHLNNARLHRFPVGQFSHILHNNVDWCRDVNFPKRIFKNYIIKRRFSKKRKNFSKMF